MNYLRKSMYLPMGVLCGFFFSAPSASELTGLANTIGIVTQKIDSLDLLKQDLKRKGQAIIEIERQQELLRDSLHQLRNKLQTVSQILPGASEKKRTPFFFLKPANLFDWIIVVTGLIASFSGLMLIIGISRMLNMRRKLKPRKPPVENRGIAQPVGVKNGIVAAAFPEDTTAAASPTPSPVTDTSSINQIRQRMGQQSADIDSPPEIPDLPPVPPPASTDASSEDDTIENKVLAASRRGLDVTTISRKFHLSADHVALILKMGEKKSRAG